MKKSVLILCVILTFGCQTNDSGNNEESNYQLGGNGQGGGIIFYDKGFSSNGWRYLEITPYDLGKEIEWGCWGQEINNANKTGLGEGDINTESIKQQCNVEIIAARICFDLTLNSKSDWYLPSRDELKLIYENLYLNGLGNFFRGIDDFTPLMYWSSSQFICESSADSRCEHNAYIKEFEERGGYDDYLEKYTEARVRAVRKF